MSKKFVIDGHKKFYLTKTPHQATDHESLTPAEIKEHNFGEEWERCIYITEFHDAQGRNYRAKNVHLGLGEFHRKKACEMLIKDSEQAVAKNPDILEIITGDFNTFPDWGGPAQLEIMKKGALLEEVSAQLRLPNGQPTDTSFIAFPYDFAANERRLNDQNVKERGTPLGVFLSSLPAKERKKTIGTMFKTECQALCGQLDRVFQHGFKKSGATLIPTPQFEDFDINKDSFDEPTVKDFIVRHYEDGPAFASDHQPVLAVCQLPQ